MIKVYCLLGHGGIALSPGFAAWGKHLHDEFGYAVEIKSGGYYKNQKLFVDDVMLLSPKYSLVLAGYSLGGNACAWIASELAKMGKQIALIIGFDPTVNGPPLFMYPIQANVKRCICFHQVTRLRPTSWLLGRGLYERSVTGPKIEQYDIVMDHAMVQFNRQCYAIAEKAIAEIK